MMLHFVFHFHLVSFEVLTTSGFKASPKAHATFVTSADSVEALSRSKDSCAPKLERVLEARSDTLLREERP